MLLFCLWSSADFVDQCCCSVYGLALILLTNIVFSVYGLALILLTNIVFSVYGLALILLTNVVVLFKA